MNMLWRALEGVPEGADVDTYAFVTQVFKNIALAQGRDERRGGARRSATSAATDGVSFDRARQLAEAKARAIGLAQSGYHPPAPRAYMLPGESGIATLQMMVDTLVARRLRQRARRDDRDASSPSVLCGGVGGARARGHRGRDARARARGVRQPLRRAEEPGAHAVHAHEQQAAEELGHDHEDVVIVDAVRSAVGRAHKGSLAQTRPDELAGEVIAALLARVPQVKPADVEDVVLGCAMPEGEQGLNVARVVGLLGGLPVETSGDDHQPLLLERPAGDRDRGGRDRASASNDVVIAGGVESMTMVPMTGNKLVGVARGDATRARTSYTPMGITAENVAKRFGIARADQDEFALESQQKAAAAHEGGQVRRRDRAGARRSRYDGGKRVERRVHARRAVARRHDARGPRGAQAGVRARRQVTAGNARRSPTARRRRS